MIIEFNFLKYTPNTEQTLYDEGQDAIFLLSLNIQIHL